MSFSQHKQDLILHDCFFRDIREGTFVELGAMDGIKFSNTYYYEKNLGWSGLCVEPNPFEFKKLCKNRTCIVENCLVSDDTAAVSFLAIDGYGAGLSGIVSNYDEKHLKRVNADKESKGLRQYIALTPVTLQSLLNKHRISHINFLSLDVEGSELSVLKSIDFDSTVIDYMLIENNYDNDDVFNYVVKLGYRRVKKIASDDVYIREKLCK